MSWFLKADNKSVDDKLVVVLQADQAHWFKWSRGELVDTYTESISGDRVTSTNPCLWNTQNQPGGDLRVRLVLNTTLDELDRVKLDKHYSAGVNWVQRHRVRASLKKEYPYAGVHLLPDCFAPDVFSLLHSILPAEWTGWLQQIQNAGCRFSHVATATQLLCSIPLDGLALFNTGAGVENRHLLVQDNTPVFMRCVDADLDNKMSVDESLAHVRSLLQTDYSSVAVVEDVADASQCADTLARLILGCPVALHYTSESQGERTITVNNSKDGRFVTLADNKWRLTKARQGLTDSLEQSILRNHRFHKLIHLQRATVLCTLMAAITVIIASVNGIESARARSELAQEEQQLLEQIHELSSSVAELHQSPEHIANAIKLIRQHKAINPATPRQILTTVAKGFSRFPVLLLDSLSWSVIDDGELLDSSHGATSRTMSRNSLWHVDSIPPRVLVELAGSVSRLHELRDQQAVLNAFVRYLESVPGVTQVEVLESPVTTAQSSVQFARSNSNYRVSLILGAS